MAFPTKSSILAVVLLMVCAAVGGDKLYAPLPEKIQLAKAVYLGLVVRSDGLAALSPCRSVPWQGSRDTRISASPNATFTPPRMLS
jgi:hypothetical protein